MVYSIFLWSCDEDGDKTKMFTTSDNDDDDDDDDPETHEPTRATQ